MSDNSNELSNKYQNHLNSSHVVQVIHWSQVVHVVHVVKMVKVNCQLDPCNNYIRHR
jgi:hypothetical protein